MALTKRQKEVLDYLVSFETNMATPPALRKSAKA